MRAVFDTNVFVRALIDPRSRCGRLLSEFSDDYVLVVFPAIVFELLSVITRHEFRRNFHIWYSLTTVQCWRYSRRQR